MVSAAAAPATPGSSSPSPSALLSWRPLKQISLKQMAMEPREWNQVIEAMDFSALEYLSLFRNNFPQEQGRGIVQSAYDWKKKKTRHHNHHWQH
jgi:hypothetical protein